MGREFTTVHPPAQQQHDLRGVAFVTMRCLLVIYTKFRRDFRGMKVDWPLWLLVDGLVSIAIRWCERDELLKHLFSIGSPHLRQYPGPPRFVNRLLQEPTAQIAYSARISSDERLRQILAPERPAYGQELRTREQTRQLANRDATAVQ